MIPLMFLVLLIEQVGRKGILLINPIVRAVENPHVRAVATEGISAGALINWGLTAGLVLGFALSLQERSSAR